MASHSSGGLTGREILLNDTILLSTLSDDLFVRKELHDRLLESITAWNSRCRSPNYLLYGKPGVGKSHLANQLLASLKSKGIKCVYANCWRYYTQMAVYSLIAREIGEAIPRRGLATDEVFDRLVQVLDRSGEHVVVILDEIDGLLFNQQQRLLFDIAGTRENKQSLLFVGICDEESGFTELDERIRATLGLIELEVKQYSRTDLEKIIAYKAEKALTHNSFDQGVLDACVNRTIELNGNLRLGLQLLWRAGLRAEQSGREKILVEDIRQIEKTCLYHSRVFDVLKNIELTREERLIVSILSRGAATSTRLYNEFRKHIALTKRQIRNYIRRLSAREIISVVEQPEFPAFFKSRVFRLNV